MDTRSGSAVMVRQTVLSYARPSKHHALSPAMLSRPSRSESERCRGSQSSLSSVGCRPSSTAKWHGREKFLGTFDVDCRLSIGPSGQRAAVLVLATSSSQPHILLCTCYSLAASKQPHPICTPNQGERAISVINMSSLQVDAT